MNKFASFFVLNLVISLLCIGTACPNQATQKTLKSLLKKVKSIDPHAQQTDYFTLFQELKKHNLTVKQCTELLLERKKEKALKKIKEKGCLSDENIATIQEFHHKLQIADAQKKIKLVIHVSPDIALTKKEKEELEQTFCDRYTVTFKNAQEIYDLRRLTTNSDLSALHGTCCNRKYKETTINNQTSIAPGSCHLYIGTDFAELTFGQRKATLLHEKIHLLNNHRILDTCYNNALERNLKYLYGNKAKPAVLSYHPFYQALEVEADRLAIASHDLETASYFIELFAHHQQEDNLITQQSIQKRLAWSLRLYKLKEAEKQADMALSSCIQSTANTNNFSNSNMRFTKQNEGWLPTGMKLLPIALSIIKSKNSFGNGKGMASKPLRKSA